MNAGTARTGSGGGDSRRAGTERPGAGPAQKSIAEQSVRYIEMAAPSPTIWPTWPPRRPTGVRLALDGRGRVIYEIEQALQRESTRALRRCEDALHRSRAELRVLPYALLPAVPEGAEFATTELNRMATTLR
jgi:hypothetical protein